MAQIFPSDWRDQACYIVAIPAPLVPFVGGFLAMMELRGFWESETDYENGYTAVVELEGCLMATCLNDLMELQQAQYRLLNTAIYGVGYETVSTDPLIVEPAIAPHVTTDIHSYASMMGRLENILQLIDNSLNGTETPHYDNPPSVRAKLQEVIDAIVASGEDDGEILETLISILGALA